MAAETRAATAPARWVLASANPGKQREFAALLAPHGIELMLQSALGISSIEETGTSFEANALLKARHAAAHSGLPALADDSGIEVDALDGRPGVYSARYAGRPDAGGPGVDVPGADDADAANNRKMLAELSGVPEARRTARYRCVLALVDPTASPQRVVLADGRWEGRIATAPAGTGGFGYDVIFLPAGFSITSAQMSAAQKNALSHRAAAWRSLAAQCFAPASGRAGAE